MLYLKRSNANEIMAFKVKDEKYVITSEDLMADDWELVP